MPDDLRNRRPFTINVPHPLGFAELATATGFYYRKAQKENEIKIPHYLASQGLTEGTVNPEDDPENYGN